MSDFAGTQTILLDTNDMQWENGLDVVNKMTPEFRDNLGPADRVRDTFSKYWQKTLRIDPSTTRRIDLIYLEPGYSDLTYAYHDSVEECFCLSGGCYLGGEGPILQGEYFWRPPGWVHTAWSQEGFRALLSLEGRSPESGPTSRRIRPLGDAGTNGINSNQEDERAIGPRGWVRRLDTRLVAWQPGAVYARGEGKLEGFDADHLAVRVLSKNPLTGAQSLLVRLEPGYRQVSPGRIPSNMEWFVVSGFVAFGGTSCREGTYCFQPGRSSQPPLSSESGATLFLKSDSWLEFELA